MIWMRVQSVLMDTEGVLNVADVAAVVVATSTAPSRLVGETALDVVGDDNGDSDGDGGGDGGGDGIIGDFEVMLAAMPTLLVSPTVRHMISLRQLLFLFCVRTTKRAYFVLQKGFG